MLVRTLRVLRGLLNSSFCPAPVCPAPVCPAPVRGTGSASGPAGVIALATLASASLALALPAQAEVTVGVSDWPGWTAWYIAEEKGFFKKHGADVKLVWFASYTDSISALSSGQVDANCQTWSDTMGPLAKGIPVKVVMVNDNSAGNDAIMAKPEVASLADLKGKKIALEQYSVSHFLLVNALAKAGMKADDLEVVNLSAGDAAAAFMTGRVDAAALWNPWISQIQSAGTGKPVFTSADMPGLIPDLLVAQTSAIEGKRKDLVGMIKAWFDVVAFIESNPAEASAIMAKVVGLEAAEYQVMLPGTKFFGAEANLTAFGPASDGASLRGVAPTIESFLSANDLIEGAPDVEAGLDGSLVTEAVGK